MRQVYTLTYEHWDGSDASDACPEAAAGEQPAANPVRSIKHGGGQAVVRRQVPLLCSAHRLNAATLKRPVTAVLQPCAYRPGALSALRHPTLLNTCFVRRSCPSSTHMLNVNAQQVICLCTWQLSNLQLLEYLIYSYLIKNLQKNISKRNFRVLYCNNFWPAGSGRDGRD